MPIKVSCPGCQANLTVPDRLAGKSVKCQKCANIFKVPAPAHAETAPAAKLASAALVVPAMSLDNPPKPAPAKPVEPIFDALVVEPILDAIVVEPVKPAAEIIVATLVEPPADAPPRPKRASPPAVNANARKRPLPNGRGLTRAGVMILGFLAVGFLFVVLAGVAAGFVVKIRTQQPAQVKDGRRKDNFFDDGGINDKRFDKKPDPRKIDDKRFDDKRFDDKKQ